MNGLPMTPEMIDALMQLGVAGVIGVLWVWERLLSRRREQQLSEAHNRLMQQKEHLAVLIKLVHRNTRVIERFEQTLSQLGQVLEQVRRSIREKAA